MARLWHDGFEYGSNVIFNWLYVSNGGGVSAGSPFTGIYRLYLTAGQYAYYPLQVAKSETYMKIHLEPVTVAQTGALCGFYKGTTCLGWLQQVNRDVKFFSGSGTGTQLGATAVNALSALGTDYNLIEIRLKLDDTNGYAQVKVNSLVIDFGPGDTMPSSDSDMDRIYLGTCGGSASPSQLLIDDFIIDDADWIGNRRVCKIQPTGADASFTNWIPSTPPNWDCVNEIPYDEGDFIRTNSIDQIDFYACSDLPGTAISAKGIMLIGRAVGEGEPTPRNVQLGLRTDSSNYFGDSYLVPLSSPANFFQYWHQNPKTSADFSVSEINDIKVGIKSVT